MRPASHTSRGITTSERPTDTAISQPSTAPSAMRTGITIGAQKGMYDSQTTIGLSGAHGAMLMATMYGTIIRAMTGLVTEPTSSWRDTRAPSAAAPGRRR